METLSLFLDQKVWRGQKVRVLRVLLSLHTEWAIIKFPHYKALESQVAWAAETLQVMQTNSVQSSAYSCHYDCISWKIHTQKSNLPSRFIFSCMRIAICYLIFKATKWQLHLFFACCQIWHQMMSGQSICLWRLIHLGRHLSLKKHLIYIVVLTQKAHDDKG